VRRSRTITAALVAAVAVAGAGVATLARRPAPIDETKLVTVEAGRIVRSVVATGRIEPITKVEIKSKANGIIERLAVNVDDKITAGQVLAELDRENLAARAREARAALEAAQASREAAAAQLGKSEIEAEGPDVDFARRALARAQKLFADRLIAQSQLDDAQSAVAQAENRQRAAKAQLLVARSRLAEATAAVAQARAAVQRAEEELANATIKAPIRGTVLTRDVEIGSAVSSILNLGANATLVMTVGDIERVYVKGKVDEADIGHVRLGMPATITTETFRDRKFTGQVTRISPIGVEKDNVTTFAVEVSIANATGELRPNMTANAEIVLEELPESLLVPESAVSYDARRNATVQVVDATSREGRRAVPVKVGVGNGTRIQVTSGLKAGDRVILPS